MTGSWLALMIGNSRLHWGWFLDSTLRQTWDTPHLAPQAIASLFTPNRSSSDAIPDAARDLLLPLTLQPDSPLWIASVVPSQTTLWQVYPHARVMTLGQVPIRGLYPSLGIDRALAVWGAATQGAPVLVIDAGTALTFTGVDQDMRLVGGAIVAGLQTQVRSLAQNTAALPMIEPRPLLPERWAMNTPDAIRSGVIYTVLATIRDYCEAWLVRFPGGAIALTGGDSGMLMEHLQTQYPAVLGSAIAAQIKVEPHLIFWGMQSVVGSSIDCEEKIGM
jgi:type III pantothenate kinase